MSYQEITGNIFASKAEAVVNTVNCVGPMGKGIALEFRRRFPEMFEEYQRHCEAGTLKPGMILPYRKSTPRVLNFAVKNDWKHPSRIEWVEQTLEKFCEWYPSVGLKSVAFPWMGAMNGGIPLEDIQKVTRDYLSHLPDIDIEVYTFDPDAPDPLFENLKNQIASQSMSSFIKDSGVQKRFVERIFTLMEGDSVTSLTGIEDKAQLGKVSMDKLYLHLSKHQDNPTSGTLDETELF